MTDFDEIAAAREVVDLLCSGLDLPVPAYQRKQLGEALESVPTEKLRLLLKLMREKHDGTE